MYIRAAASYAGSLVATAGAVASLVFAQAGPTPPPPMASAPQITASNASNAALVIAIGGLLSTVLPHAHAALKLYLDERREDRRVREERHREDRKAADARHELASRTQALEFELAWLKGEREKDAKTIEDNRRLISLLARHDDPPSGEHPDPKGELRRALEDSESKGPSS